MKSSPELVSFESESALAPEQLTSEDQHIEEIRTHGQELGLSSQEIEDAVADFRAEMDDGGIEAVTEQASIEAVVEQLDQSGAEGSFDKIEQSLKNAEEGLLEASGELGELSETLGKFTEKLVELIKDMETILNKMANVADSAELESLKADLQERVNQFGREF